MLARSRAMSKTLTHQRTNVNKYLVLIQIHQTVIYLDNRALIARQLVYIRAKKHAYAARKCLVILTDLKTKCSMGPIYTFNVIPFLFISVTLFANPILS